MSYLTQHPHTSSRLQNEKAKNLGEKRGKDFQKSSFNRIIN